MWKFFLGAAAYALLSGTVAHAETAAEDAARFGARETVLQIALSPNGDKVVFVTAGPEHSEVVKIVDLAGGTGIRTITSNTEQHADISYCSWATNDRLVCSIVGMGKRSDDALIPYRRMFAINDDGSDADMITERANLDALQLRQDGGAVVALEVEGEDGQILITKQYVKEGRKKTRLTNDKEGLGVDLFDVSNGKRKTIERPDNRATGYVADENGNVRLKLRAIQDSAGLLTGETAVAYRPAEGGRWNLFGDVTLDGKVISDFLPIAVSASKNVAYGYHSTGTYDAIVEVPLDSDNSGKIIMARDDVDVDSLIRIGRNGRVVGGTYATEKRAIKYFDPELAKLAASLGKALPNQPLVNIISTNSDETRMLIVASSDTDPGTVYLYDKSTRQLQLLFAVREMLADRPMGSMKPISYPAADGTLIPGYLTLPAGIKHAEAKGLPAIVLPHGGPSARDEWGFDWLVQFFTARGYAVLQPNYRGSSGYGDAWYGRNGFKAWDAAIGDINDAGKWLAAEGIANPDKLAIVGWSYGGYAALQSQVVDPQLFKAVVGIAPVTDLGFLRTDNRYYTDRRIARDFVGDGPHLQAGSPLRHADSFQAPVALFHGTMDLNVDVRHSREMEDRLEDAGKAVSYTEYKGLQHDLGDSNARTDMLTKIDTFLATSLGK